MYCWNCGDHNPNDYRFCGKCGLPGRHSDDEAGSAARCPPTKTQDTSFEDIRAFESVIEKIFRRGPFRTIHGDKAGRSHGFRLKLGRTRRSITDRDSDGRVQTFTHTEEMPPEVRRCYEGVAIHLV